jgi:osmotically-inducible protein OsmY
MASRVRSLVGLAAIALFAVALAGACKTTTSAGRQVDDAGIKSAVKAKLAADVRFSTLTNIEVNSTNGVVTLAGQVHNESERIAAEKVALTVDGVVRVNNELQVKGASS